MMEMQSYFYALADAIKQRVGEQAMFTAYFSAEDSSFVRLNQNKVRQAGDVHQLELSLTLIQDGRQVHGDCNLSGDLDLDRDCVARLLKTLRQQCSVVPKDPYLNFAEEVQSSENIASGDLPTAENMLREIVTSAAGMDLVGLLATGTVYRGFANAFGQRNWYQNNNFNLDWSCYDRTDKAIKTSYCGFQWSADSLDKKMEAVRGQLGLLRETPKTLTPGGYRVYLAPAALTEILGLLGWYSFSHKGRETSQTALIKLIKGERFLHPSVRLSEEGRDGIGPSFTKEGFIKPERVVLVDNGRYQQSLAGPRSSKEYGVPVNTGEESPSSLVLGAGGLALDDVAKYIDNGVYISNLWYTNFSDSNDARITGMTRYACCWIEDCKPRSPINAMRFDESLYNFLGKKLVDLTAEREWLLDPGTYQRRALSGMYLPGALIEDFTFTL